MNIQYLFFKFIFVWWNKLIAFNIQFIAMLMSFFSTFKLLHDLLLELSFVAVESHFRYFVDHLIFPYKFV